MQSRRDFLIATPLVLASAISTATARADQGRDQDQDQDALARATLALHLHLQSLRASPPPPPPQRQPQQAKTTATAKTVIYVYTPTFHCPACDRAKAFLQGNNDLEQSFQFTKLPRLTFKPDSYPMFYWSPKPNAWAIIYGWTDYDRFQAQYHQTPMGRESSRLQHNNYNPVYNWPGSLAHHLSTFHRQLISGMSQDQMERLHDRLHGVR